MEKLKDSFLQSPTTLVMEPEENALILGMMHFGGCLEKDGDGVWHHLGYNQEGKSIAAINRGRAGSQRGLNPETNKVEDLGYNQAGKSIAGINRPLGSIGGAQSARQYSLEQSMPVSNVTGADTMPSKEEMHKGILYLDYKNSMEHVNGKIAGDDAFNHMGQNMLLSLARL